MSARRSTRPKKKSTPTVLPSTFGGPGQETLLTSGHTKQIQDLIDLLRRNNLTELELEREGVRIRVRHESAVRSVTTSVQESAQVTPKPSAYPTAAEPVENAEGMITITSPIVGTFYRSPSPDADPYVEEGDVVKRGQVLCIVEAMKLMNEIESEMDGRIVKILAESTKPVEYGQALFLMDPKVTS